MEFKINDEISLSYIEISKTDGVDYYKYKINNLKTKNINNKYVYFEEKIAPEHIDKEKLYRHINENVLVSDEENLFIDIRNFKLENKQTQNNQINNSAGGGGSESNGNSGVVRIANWDAFEDLASLIKSARECNLDRVENLHKNIGSKLPNSHIYDGISNSSYSLSKSIMGFAEGRGPSQVVEDYISFLNETRQEYIKIYAEDELLKIKSRELELPEMFNDAQREAVYRDYEDELNKIIKGEKVPETIYEYSSIFRDIKDKYTPASSKNWEDVLSVASLTEESEDLKDMSKEEKEYFLKNAETTRDSIYEVVKDELNISRDEFDNLLRTEQEGLKELARLLEENSKNDVQYRLTGEGELSNLNNVFYQFEDMWYSTSAGQEALINKFIETSITENDPDHAMAYTDYIKYCMDRGHRDDWLRDDLKCFGNAIDKIKASNIFVGTSDEELSLEEQKRVGKFVDTYGYLPFGYVYDDKDDKYKAVQFTKEGEAMLQYMDYHCGEDDPNGNSGEDRVITAFSVQGKLDACERNYKVEWIDDRTTNLSKSGQITKQEAATIAERDYNILNGDIKDDTRLEQLKKDGNMSFQDIIDYVRNNESKLINSEEETIYDKISDKEFIEDNFSSIIDEKEEREGAIKDFSVKAPEINDVYFDAQQYGDILAGSAAVVTVIKALEGVTKHLEGIGDGIKTFLHSNYVSDFMKYQNQTWEEFSDNKEVYDKQYFDFANSAETEKITKEYFEKNFYNYETGKYTGLDGKIYSSYDDIPLSAKQSLITNLFKDSKFNEWSFNDSSSSNYYLATFKEGIRNGGDFSSFDSLDTKIVEQAAKQLDIKNEVAEDKTSKKFEEQIYNKEWYNTIEDYSVVKKDNILGVVANQVGNMTIPVVASILGGSFGVPAIGKAISSSTLFTSAFGGGAEEAFASGASYNEGLKYAFLSATTELAIESAFAGIGGLGEGFLDKYVKNKVTSAIGNETLNKGVLGQSIKSLITGGIGESIEEVATDFVTPLWQSLTYMNEKSYGEILNENVSLESLSQTALVSFLSSMVFGTTGIVQKTNQFNKQVETITKQVGEIPGFKEQANKILADIIGNDSQYLTSEIITKMIEDNAKKISLNPESSVALKEMQQKLSDAYQTMTENIIELETKDGSVKLSRELTMNISDITGLSQTSFLRKTPGVTIDGNKIIFKDDASKTKFISALYSSASNTLNNQLVQNENAIEQYKNAIKMNDNGNLNLEDLSSAIQVLNELGDKNYLSEALGSVIVDVNGENITIPKSIIHEVTSKYNIKDGKIVFTEDNMNAKEFSSSILSLAIEKLTLKNDENVLNVQIFNAASMSQSIELLEEAANLIGNNLDTYIVNSMNIPDKNLVKLEVKTKANDGYKTVNVYIDSTTSSSVYMHNDLLTKKIQEIINQNPNKDDIYIGEISYDKKNNEMIIKQNTENKVFITNNKQLMDEINLATYKFEFNNGTDNESINIYIDAETDMTIFENNNVKKKINEIIKENLKVNPNNNDIYIGKIELRNGQSYVVKGENYRAQKAYVDSKTELIVTTERSNVGNTDLIKLETYVTIDGKTEKVNTYLDSNSNTSLLSDKNAKEKILEIIVEEKKNNSETKDVYVGELVRDKKSGNIVAKNNNISLEQFSSVVVASAVVSGTNSASTTKTVSTTTTTETNDKTKTNTEIVTDDIVIDTKNIVTASMVKSKIDKFIEDIQKTVKEFVSIHKNNEDFNMKLEQLKVDTDIKFNEVIVEVTEEVNNSYNEVIEQINKKLNSLKDNDSQIDVLKEQIDTLTKKRAEEIRKIKEIDTSKIDEIFNSIDTSSNVNTDDLLLKFLSIDEIIKKPTEQMELFIEKIKNECQRFSKSSHKTKETIETFIEEQKNKYEVKLEETKKSFRESYDRKLKEINEKIKNAKDNTALKEKLINTKNELISKYKEHIQKLTENSNTQFENIISNFSISNIETTINDFASNVRKTIRNSFNNLNPNNSVNRFANKINSLIQITNDANIKEVLDKYITLLETSNDVKVREEIIKTLDSKLTNKQKETLIDILEEIGSFINHYGINGENISKFYNAITMEEKPSKVIRKEVNQERIAKLKDKKALVKNVAIGAIVSYTTDPTALLLYDQMYKYVEIRKQTGTVTDNTLLGKMLDSKLGKFIDTKIESMKTIEVVERNNTLENNIKLPKKVAGVKPSILEKYLNGKNLLLELSKQEPTLDNAKLIFALKTTEIMQKNIGIELDKETIKIINQMYNDNINDIARYSISNKLSKVYYRFDDLTKKTRNVNSAIKELEKEGYKPKQIADALLSTSIVSPNSNSARVLYDKAFDYLVEKGYSKKDAANVVGSIYSDLINKKGFETISTKEGYKIYIQKGINWNNQAYTIDYIQNEIFKLKNAYKADFPIDIYVYDTFNPYDKYWEIEYKSKDFKSAATGGNNTINIYDNKVISETTLKHEFGHLVDWQIMKDSKQKGRFANSEEWLNAIERDDHAPTGYAKTNSVEDFAESVAQFLKDPKKFKRQFKNRYNVLVKYIDVNAYQNANIESQILTTTNSINVAITEVIDEIKLTKHHRVKNIQTIMPQDIDSLNIESNNDVILEDISDKKVSIPVSFEANSISKLTNKISTTQVDTKLLEELTQDSSKLARRLFGLSQKIPKDAIKDGVIKYIDFAKENNIPIQIDENVQKWYDAVKNTRENNLILTNENGVIRNGATPETKSIFDDYIKYNKYGADIKVSELLEMIDGKTNISLTLTQFTTALNNLSNYISQNGIKLNENITNILNQITNIEQNQVVINPIEVINGESPIILSKYIKVDERTVNTIELIESISNKNNLVGLISNNVYIDGLQYVNIEKAVVELFNMSPELSIQYNDILDLINEVKNNYVLFDSRTTTYAILPKEINGVKAETIFELASSFTETINRIINSEDVEVINKYKSAIDSIINLVNEKGLQIDVSDLVDLKNKLDVPETKYRNIFGNLHKAYSWNQEMGGTYGPEQSAVGKKLSEIGLKSAVEAAFNMKMTDIEFFNHLGLDSVTQEKFKKILDKNYRKQNGIFARVLGNYVNNEISYQEIQKLTEIVKNNIPGLDDKQAFMFLYYMEAGEIGANGICSYADAASIIINEYLGNPIKFEQDFGFPMYTVNNEGNRIYNYEMLIVDMYSTINKDTLLTFDNEMGNVIFESTNEKQIYMSYSTGLNEEALNKYFKDKNIELSLNKTFEFNSVKDAMHYEKILSQIAQQLEKGNTVHLGARGFDLVNEQGNNVADDVGGHAMTVLGINSDGNLVVNSWGKIAIFDLKVELAKTGSEYFDKDANGNVVEKYTSSLIIQSFETKESVSEFDGVIELSKHSNRGRVQSNIDASEVKNGSMQSGSIEQHNFTVIENNDKNDTNKNSDTVVSNEKTHSASQNFEQWYKQSVQKQIDIIKEEINQNTQKYFGKLRYKYILNNYIDKVLLNNGIIETKELIIEHYKLQIAEVNKQIENSEGNSDLLKELVIKKNNLINEQSSKLDEFEIKICAEVFKPIYASIINTSENINRQLDILYKNISNKFNSKKASLIMNEIGSSLLTPVTEVLSIGNIKIFAEEGMILSKENIKVLNDAITRIQDLNSVFSDKPLLSEVVIRNTPCPNNYVLQLNSDVNIPFSVNNSVDTNNGTIQVWDGNVEEQKIIYQFAHMVAKQIVENSVDGGLSISNGWLEAMVEDNSYVSLYSRISISNDFADSLAKFIMNPQKFASLFKNRANKICRLTSDKKIDKAIRKNYVTLDKKQRFVFPTRVNDANIEMKKYKMASAELNRLRTLLNNDNISNFTSDDYNKDYSVMHLINGEKTISLVGQEEIKGTHNKEKLFEKINQLLDLYNGININDVIINLNNPNVHPSISGIMEIRYKLPDRNGNWIESRMPKTVFDPNTFSDEYIYGLGDEAINKNGIQVADGVVGLASNGLWFTGYYENAQLKNFFPVIKPDDKYIKALKNEDGMYNIKVPVLTYNEINGKTKQETTLIDVFIKGEISDDIFKYGKALIAKIEREVLKNNTTRLTFDKLTSIELFDLNETYSYIPTTTLLDFVKLDVDGIAKVFINKQEYNGYDADTMLDAIIEVYNYSKENNINISINPNLEHFIKEYQVINLENNNELSNLRRALYNKESIISLPTGIKLPSYRSVSVNILFDILNGKKDVSTTYYSEIDIYDATKEILKYFEGKNVTISEKIKKAFDEVKNIDENSTIINFIDVLNGKEKIVLPKEIEGKYGNSNISDVIQYLYGDSSFISTGVIENLKEYINANNLYIPSDMMDKINLLSSLGEDNVLLNEKAYLKGESSPIIVPKKLEGIYTNTSDIYGWITGEEKLYNLRTIEEVIELTTKFTEYIYSNNIMLDNTTMSKLEVLKNLKEDETIINIEDFFNGSSAIIVKNSINVNGINIKLSTILDAINLTDNTHLKILSGKNIDGVTRENIFDAIDELYKVRPELRLTTISNYSKIKNIYDNNYIFNERYLFPKTFNDITCELIEEILTNPIRIAKYNSDERIQIIDAINEYIELIGDEVGKYFAYNERVKMRDSLLNLISREIPQIDLLKEVYSPLYYEFSNTNDNGGTFGTNQGVIREMLKDLGIKDSVKALFFNETISDDNFLTDLGKLDITKEKLTQALNDLFWNPKRESVARLINFIKNNKEIRLVQKNFPGMNGVDAIRFLYLAETVEAGNNGICNYAAATNMIFNKYLGKEASFEADFGYPMYIINSQGKKVLNDSMLLVDMYSIINKGVLVKEINGKYEIATTNDNYLNLADVGRFEIDYLQRFIDAKGIDLGLKENFYYSSYEGHIFWKEELILKIKESLEKGEYINVSGAGFDLLRKDGSIACKDCGGHIMTLVGLTTDGKVIVDSWGQELLIDLESTLEHIGEKYGRDGYTRRLAIASYELTNVKTNVNIKSNHLSGPYLETFDIPREIDMIDESTKPNQNLQIQTDNVKQLSIIDNIKHTLQRINDKFTGYKMSKLNIESYYEKTTKSNNKLFKRKQINKTFRDFANRHLIDLENLINNGLLRNPKISEINSLITNNRVLSNMIDGNVSIADILGTKKNVDLDKNFSLLFNESASEFQTRDLGLLEYTSDQILGVLSESFKNHPIIISEVDTGKYIIEDNGYHRYSILRLHYLNEYIKVKNNPELVRELNEKYTIPVKVYKLDTTKTYCTSILKELGMNIEVKTKGFKKTSSIFIDGKKVIMSDTELIEFTKNMINSTSNSTQIINKLLSESESFKEFYNENFMSETNDYGIDFDVESFTENSQIEVNNKTYSLDTIIDIFENKYLDILKGRTIEGINSQNMFSIFNKVFESNSEIKNKYKTNYDNIVDIFKTKYVHENGNLYPKTFNFIKTQDIIEILKQPYKLQRYSKEKRTQINKAINQYVEYAISNNYDLTPKEYKGYSNVTSLMSRDVPNVKLTSEVESELLNEFRRNIAKGGTFGSKQGVIRTLLERNGITNAINYLFNKDATGTKFLEQIKDFTDEDFQDLLDNAVDETGRLDGLYNLYDEFELFELMRNNFEGIEDLEIIKFLYLFESTEAGAKGICNYSVAVNMIFNKYLGNEQQFEVDFGYPMYVIKNSKKVLNDMMLLVDMYSTINEEIFTEKVDGVVKVIATNNKKYLPVTNPGGSFNIDNLQKFIDKKGIKLDLNQTFKYDSRFDTMWKEEILSNVKQALEKGETVNLSAQGFDLYRKDGKTIAAKDFEGHAMTVVGLTKDGNLIVDSHGMEMIVNLDLTLENAGKVYLDKNEDIKFRRIGIATYSFDSSVSSSNQNMDIIDVSDSIVSQEFDEGIFDIFSKPTGDIELFKDALTNNKVDTLTEHEINSLIENINKGKIKPKDYSLNAETIRILIDKVPLKKIFPISNVTAIKSFIDYFKVDTLIEFDKLNNGFLFENNGENLYSLYDYHDLSIPKSNETDKLKEFNKLIKDTIISNKKTEHKTYTFNYSGLINSEFSKIHPDLFLDENVPQDLKNVFYNGLVNSSNEYKPEWSPYLEGKTVKGIKHKPLMSYEDTKIVKNINSIGENSTKYVEGLIELANKTGMTTIEVENILISKLKRLIETSEFGVRRTLKSLDGILESGKLKNQFEVNHSSYGVSNTDMRMDMEKDLFGIPRNIKYEDRPIYGMLLPEDLTSKYVQKGPGAYYSEGSGVIYIFDKSKIMNNATITLGDSIDQASKICATNLSNPRYFGMFSEMLSTIKTREDLMNFEFTSLYDKSVMEVGNSAYYEFQLHGSDSHTLDNLKEIVFLKMPEAKIIEKLEEKNIKWRVIDENSKKHNSPSIKNDKVIKKNEGREGYFTFDRTKEKPIKELSAYYGDAGKRVNSLFLEGKTTDEVMEELTIFEKNKFKKFLEETIQGRYLTKLTDDEITALSLYTKDHFTEINFVLRHNNQLDSIAGRNPEILIKNIDSAISKYGGLEQPMIIYRAVDVRAFTHQDALYKELFKGIKVYNMKEVYAVLKTLEGKEFSDLGYMSSSPAYGTSFAKHLRYSIILEIAAPKGTECAYINQLSSFYNAENEILLARNTKLQIVEVLEPEEDIFNFTKVVVRCIVKE